MSIVANAWRALTREPDATAVAVLALLLGIGAGGLGHPASAIPSCEIVAPEAAPLDLNWDDGPVGWESAGTDLDEIYLDPEAGIGPI